MTPVDDSQILRVPLARRRRAAAATPAAISSRPPPTPTTDDPDVGRSRRQMLDFAMGDPGRSSSSPDNVQPMLLQRGCAFQACHSPQASNDFKLRIGNAGFFSADRARARTTSCCKNEFMAIEFPDARRGRAVAKTSSPTTIRASPASAASPTAAVPCSRPRARRARRQRSARSAALGHRDATAFCTIQEWLTRRARGRSAPQVTPMNAATTMTIVYVDRPPAHAAGRLEFDTFQGGADLRVAHDRVHRRRRSSSGRRRGRRASLLGGVRCSPPAPPTSSAPTSRTTATASCSPAQLRRRAARACTSSTIDGADLHARHARRRATPNGIKVHNFDPAWSPDGTARLRVDARQGRPDAVAQALPAAVRPLARRCHRHRGTAPPEQMTFLLELRDLARRSCGTAASR